MISRRTTFLGVLILLLAAAILVWRFGFYTYFQRTEVHEEMPVSVGARTIASGSFVDADFVHRGSGTARIVEEDGRRFLRLENFQVTNGPDLYVYLAASKTPGSTVESLGSFLNLGRLKGNRGDQNYELPADISGYTTAVIWCQEFGVLFSYAVMR